MTPTLLLAALSMNLGCAVLVYGLEFGFFQAQPRAGREWTRDDRAVAVFAAALAMLGGPVILVSALLLCEFGRHGLRWRAR